MTILFVFPCSSSWCTFFLSMHFSWRKFQNKISFFWLFSKKSKQAILFRNFLHEKCIDRKNKIHHDEEHEKTKTMVVFLFLRCLSGCTPFFFCQCIFHGENHKTQSPVLTFWKKRRKKAKSMGQKGGGVEKKISQSHTSSSAVRASRFGPPNFFRRSPENGLISHTSCII